VMFVKNRNKRDRNRSRRSRQSNSQSFRRRLLRSSTVKVILAAVLAAAGSLYVFSNREEIPLPYRAFSSSSYWNRPLPRSAPVAPESRRVVAFLRRTATTDFVYLAGASRTGKWGHPIYWSNVDDPGYSMSNTCSFRQPSEFLSIRIPRSARPDPTSDSAMTVYDRSKGIVYGLHRAAYDEANDAWSACGGAVYYLASNGLDGSLRRSNDERNAGHRGVPPPTFAVRYDEVQYGAIRHVLKIAVPRTKCRHVFPMSGDECGSLNRYAPPEGARIRIKPSIDLSTIELSPEARIVAEALQDYGAVIGDQSGGPVSLKLENTLAEGRGQLWDGVLSSDSLAAIPLGSYEVIRFGYDPTRD
jgi:hypothetical protein